MESQSENELLRKYLNRIAIQLMFGVPCAERRTIGQEVTQHLSAIIEDEIAEGASREQATATALRRFGDPHKVGKDIRKEWLQKHPYQNQIPETALLSKVTQMLTLVAILLIIFFGWQLFYYIINRYQINRYLPHSLVAAFLYGACFPIFSHVAGWLAECGSPVIAQILNTIGLSAIVRYRESNAEPVAKRKYIAMFLEPRASSSQKRDKSPMRAAFSWLSSHGGPLLVGVLFIFTAILIFPQLGELEKATVSGGFSIPATLAGVFFTNWALGRLKVRWVQRKSDTPSKL